MCYVCQNIGSVGIGNIEDAGLSEETEFDRLIESLSMQAQENVNMVNKVEAEISSYKKEKRLKTSESNIEFWKKKEMVYPKLYDMAKVLNGIPVSEVSIERLFLNVKFVLNRPIFYGVITLITVSCLAKEHIDSHENNTGSKEHHVTN